MASNGAIQPLMSGAVNPTSQTNNAYATNKRKFLNVKCAPLAKFVSLEFEGKLCSPEFSFGKLRTSFLQVGVFLAVYLCVGTLCFYFFLEDIKGKKTSPVIDALYFSVVTITTVGYGDLSPNTSSAKILVFVFVFTGMTLVGLIMNKVADYLTEKQEMLLVKALNKHQKNDPSTEETVFNRPIFKCLLGLAILSVLMIIGAIFLHVVEDLDIIDSLFCVCTTVTTLGFGAESFRTKGGRAFGVLWILSSTLGLGQFFLYVTEVFMEDRQRALVNRIQTQWLANLDLEAVNIDSDGAVVSAEVLIWKLKEMGKIGHEDISLALKELGVVDVGKAGMLSASDLVGGKTTLKKR